MNGLTEMNPNPLVQYLNKPSEDFTKEDIIKFIEDKLDEESMEELVRMKLIGGVKSS